MYPHRQFMFDEGFGRKRSPPCYLQTRTAEYRKTSQWYSHRPETPNTHLICSTSMERLGNVTRKTWRCVELNLLGFFLSEIKSLDSARSRRRSVQ